MKIIEISNKYYKDDKLPVRLNFFTDMVVHEIARITKDFTSDFWAYPELTGNLKRSSIYKIKWS